MVIPDGQSLTSISRILESDHVIRSPFWFTNIIIFLKREHGIVSGTYNFETSLNVFGVASRLTRGQYDMEQLKTTIPEGSTIADISQIIKKNYPAFDTVHFLTITNGKEGYLFPDTYFFGANPTPEEVLAVMTSTFNEKMSEPQVSQALQASTRSMTDIIIMASILEGEARQTETRRIVAGILWKRFDQGMPLEVDSAFKYINGKTSAELTAADLKIDSPYNTYIHTGLPPTPISNPGLSAIIAAATPIDTKYYYFLTDSQGTMHYAVTLAQHAANKAKYLK